MDYISPFEPSVFGAAWRYRWLVLLLTAVFAAAAVAYSATRPDRWTTTASLVVEDPRAQQLFASGGIQRPERYVEDQVAILESAAIADRAAQLSAEANPPVRVTTEEILVDRDVSFNTSSDLIVIGYEASDPEAAIVVANAIADAYQEARGREAVSSFEAALAELDRSIAGVNDELEAAQQRIDELISPHPAFTELEQQFGEALVRLAELQESNRAATEVDLTANRAELDDLMQQLQTLELARSLQVEDPELGVVLRDQAEAFDRRKALADRRAQLEIDAQLASTGVVLLSPARFVEASGTNLVRTLAGGIVLGGMFGVGLAYFLAFRNRRFSHRAEPELVLSSPLLAEVPDFSEEGTKTPVPVRDAPTSAAAEAFRFVAAAIEVRPSSIAIGHAQAPSTLFATESGHPRSFIVTSATLGDGKTVVAANTAIAAARRGNRVLVIDADFGDPALTRLLLGTVPPQQGLTDVVETGMRLSRATEVITVAENVQIELLGRGRVQVAAPDFLRSAGAREFFEQVRGQYDLVLIDTPPLLQVAYASTLVRYVDRVIVVVSHRSGVALLEEEQDRLAFIGTPTAGYVYNRAPLRPEMAEREGSMKDVLGLGDVDWQRRRRHRRNRSAAGSA